MCILGNEAMVRRDVARITVIGLLFKTAHKNRLLDPSFLPKYL